MNKTTENILILAGIGVVVYLILTQKNTTTPTVTVANAQPITATQFGTGSSLTSLLSKGATDVLQAVNTTWLT